MTPIVVLLYTAAAQLGGPRVVTRNGDLELSVGRSQAVAAVRGFGQNSERVDIFSMATDIADLSTAVVQTAATIQGSIQEDRDTVVSAIAALRGETAANSSAIDARLTTLSSTALVRLSTAADSLSTLEARLDPFVACARENKYLGADGQCVAPGSACPPIPARSGMSVELSPPGLGHERLPGTMATFTCPATARPGPGPAICLKNGTWGLNGLPLAGCQACTTITESCSRCNATSCLACTNMTRLRSDGSCVAFASCREVESTGTYRLANGAEVYCLVADSKKWMKVSAWSRTLRLSTGAIGSCSQANSNNCKLADSVINSVVSGNRIYRLVAAGRSQKMYLYTSNAYVDTSRSFNIQPNSGSTRGIVAGSYPGDSRLRNGGRFTRPWIDFLYINGYSRGEACERYFIAHGGLDCYGAGGRVRCITGGGNCNRYSIVNNWQVYIADI